MRPSLGRRTVVAHGPAFCFPTANRTTGARPAYVFTRTTSFRRTESISGCAAKIADSRGKDSASAIPDPVPVFGGDRSSADKPRESRDLGLVRE